MFSRRTATYDGHQERGRMRAAAPGMWDACIYFQSKGKTRLNILPSHLNAVLSSDSTDNV